MLINAYKHKYIVQHVKHKIKQVRIPARLQGKAELDTTKHKKNTITVVINLFSVVFCIQPSMKKVRTNIRFNNLSLGVN